MNELYTIEAYQDSRDGSIRYFDQYGQEYESLAGVSGLGGLGLFKKKEGGTAVGNFLRKIGSGITSIFAKKDDGTMVPVPTQPSPVPQPPTSAPAYPALAPAPAQTAGFNPLTLVLLAALGFAAYKMMK